MRLIRKSDLAGVKLGGLNPCSLSTVFFLSRCCCARLALPSLREQKCVRLRHATVRLRQNQCGTRSCRICFGGIAKKGPRFGTQAGHIKIAGRHSRYEFRGSGNYATAAKDQQRSTRWQSSSPSPTGLRHRVKACGASAKRGAHRFNLCHLGFGIQYRYYDKPK